MREHSESVLTALPNFPRVEGDGAVLRMLAYPLLAGACLFNAHIPIVAVALYSAISVATAATTYARTVRLRNGDEKPRWLTSAKPDRSERRNLPAGLAHSTFKGPETGVPLAARLTEAAQTCTLYGRRVIVISVSFDDLDSDAVELAASILRSVVRGADLVERVSSRELVIALAMVRDFAAADLVTARMRKKLSACQFLTPSKISSGASIYPLHGYSGEELIAAARGAEKRWADARRSA